MKNFKSIYNELDWLTFQTVEADCDASRIEEIISQLDWLDPICIPELDKEVFRRKLNVRLGI